MNLQEYKEKLLKNSDFKKEYEKHDLAMEISLMVLEARVLAGVTQLELAKRIKTRQPSIARLENGKLLPSLSFLQKTAEALGTYLIPPKMGSVEKYNEYVIEHKSIDMGTKVSELNSVWQNGASPMYALLLSENINSFGTNRIFR